MKTSFSLDGGQLGRNRRPVEIAMTPMIDVIFQLLVFFLATSSFNMVEKLLPSSVSKPTASKGPSDQASPEQIAELVEQTIVKIRVDGDEPVVLVNGQPLKNYEELLARFRAIEGVRSNVPVIIDPDPKVRASEVIRVYDLARVAGLTNAYLATRSR